MAGQADLLGGLGSTIGSIFGYEGTAGNRQAAQEDYENALQGYKDLSPKQAGGDLQSRMAQMQALQQLQNSYAQGGMDAQSKAAYTQAQNAANQNAAQMNAGVQNRMAAQGMGSSGANFAAQQANAQNAANSANQAGTMAAGQSAANGMRSAHAAGALAGDMGAQQNHLSQFNASQQNQMALARAQGMQSAYGGMAQNQSDQAKQQMGFASGLGQGIGGAIGGAADSGDIGGQILGSGQGGSMLSGAGGLLAAFL